MNWINIETKTLRTSEYIGSTPAERATWLSVLGYSVEQENGGRMEGVAEWKDRQWQQTCGVTLREVRAASKLLALDGADLVVAFYPLDKQRTVQQNRELASRGGRAKALANAKTCAKPNGEADGLPVAPAERNRKGKEGEDTPLTPKGESAFDAFWKAYPKKVGKLAAQKKWGQLKPDIGQCLLAISSQKATEQWLRDGGQFIPNPATWLHQGRWADEHGGTPCPVTASQPEEPDGFREWHDSLWPNNTGKSYADIPESVKADFRREQRGAV